MNTITLLFIMVLFTATYAVNVHNKVLLKNVNALTLHQGLYTTSRRSSPVKQLDCVGGSAASESYKVKTVQCVNTGFDGKDYNWKCESVLPKSLRLGKLVVNCEGYDFPDDPYVLVGSCGLEYNLEYNEDYNKNQYMPHTRTTRTTYTHLYNMNDYDVLATIFLFVFIGLCVMSVCCPFGYNSFCRYRRTIVGPMDRYVVPVTSPNVVIVPQRSSFYDGVMMGSVMSQRPVHTHTESFFGSNSGTTDTTDHTSTSFGGTRRR